MRLTTLTLTALRTLLRTIRRAWLAYEIHETDAYLRACARDGLVHSLHLEEWRARLAGMRAEYAGLAGHPGPLLVDQRRGHFTRTTP